MLMERYQVARVAARLVLTTSLTTTPEIPYKEFSQGRLYVPAGAGYVTLTFYDAPFARDDSEVPSGVATFLPSQDTTPAAIVLTVAAGKSYPIPASLAGAAALKIVADVAGPLELSLKS